MNSFTHIVSNPDILGGKPIVKGTRISVSLILEWLASGASISDIESQHPLLTKENISEAILYASHTQENEILIEVA